MTKTINQTIQYSNNPIFKQSNIQTIKRTKRRPDEISSEVRTSTIKSDLLVSLSLLLLLLLLSSRSPF